MKLDEIKLFELTGIKHMYEKDLDDILQALEENGTSVMGRGSFALVLNNSSKDEVIKFWIKDSSYDDFIDYVIKNPSPWFPKLYSKPKELTSFFLRPVDFPEKIKYVRMEKLVPIPSSLDTDYIEDLIEEPKRGEKEETIEDWLEVLKNGDKEYLKYKANAIKLFGKTKQELETFYDFANGIYNDLIVRKGHKYDIHDENVMMRGKTLVFTDPIYNGADHYDAKQIARGIKLLHDIKDNPEEMKISAYKSGRSNSKKSKEKSDET